MSATSASAISSSLSAPFLSILYGISVMSIIVDSIPMPHSPPSMTASIFPSKYWSTFSAVFGLSLPEGFAEGAAKGQPALSRSSSVIGCCGHLSPTVMPPARTIDGIKSFAFNTMVSGPGQNFSARTLAALGTSTQYFSISSAPCTISDSGFIAGLPLTSYIFFTACSSSPLPARP